MKTNFLILVIIVLFATQSLIFAQEQCSDIENNSLRLKCYDLEYRVKKLKKEVLPPSKEQALVDESSITNKNKNSLDVQNKTSLINKSFGMPRKIQSSEAKEEMGDSIKAITLVANGRINIELMNSGHVWQTKDTDEYIKRIKGLKISESDKVIITDAFLSGYILKIAGKNGAIRVTRIK